MDRINELLRIKDKKCSPCKTKLDIEEWLKIVYNRDERSLEYIVDHCVVDTDITENGVKWYREDLPDNIKRM